MSQIIFTLKEPVFTLPHLHKSRVDCIYGHETGGSVKWSPEVVYLNVKITQPWDFFFFFLFGKRKPLSRVCNKNVVKQGLPFTSDA